MCGIAGILNYSVDNVQLRGALERMYRSLRHRGPDDEGRFLAPKCGIGLIHTRLSILDLSPAGHQPMTTADGRYWIVFNGEIYNYRELREQLGAKSKEQGSANAPSAIGHLPSAISQDAWQSNSDTEVILRVYAKWGLDSLTKLRGMFAFALWDEHEQKLILARDPFGIKPLYYYQTDGLFLFASEVRALLASGLVPRKLSQNGLASYLRFGSVQDPLTIVDGVRSLLPGEYMVVGLEGSRFQVESSRYASDIFAQEKNEQAHDRREAVEILRMKLEDSIRLHLVSDVPVGAFLSGGIDSSAIVGLMTKVAEQRPKTFSVVFPESEFSEAEHARLVAKTFGTEHREILLSEDRLLGMLPSALEAMDQPTMDGVNTYVVSKAVKESGITVALSGLGGDELFAGYPSFRRARQLQMIARVPHRLRKTASAAGRAVFNGSVQQRKFWELVECDGSPHAAYTISRQLFAPNEIAALMARDRRSEIRGQWSEVGNSEIRNAKSEIGMPPHPYHLTPDTSHPDSDVVNTVSLCELQGYMANTLLRDTDCMSMAHALEVRVPFVDQGVVEFVLGLPGEWKMNGGRPKQLLVDALGDVLPEEIWRRPKMGFTLPFQRWMKSVLRFELDQALSDGEVLVKLGLNPRFACSVWQTFKEHPLKELWSRPWALYVLAKWLKRNNVSV